MASLNFWTGDIETDGLGGIMLDIAFYDGKNYYIFDDMQKALAFIIEQGKEEKGLECYFHYGRKYDFDYILKGLIKFADDYNIYIIKASEILAIRIDDKQNNTLVQFKDSHLFLRKSLKELSKKAGIKHKQEGIKEKREDLKQLKEEEEQIYYEYLKEDVRVLWEVLKQFRTRKEFRKLKWERIITPAGLAINIFIRKYDKHIKTYEDKEIRADIRKSYRGGRVEVFNFALNKDLVYLDVNSLYPYVMLYPMPMGKPQKINNISEKYAGLYKVRLYIPYETEIPPVGVRSSKLIFPVGYVEGWFWSKEILDVMAIGGYYEYFGEGYIWKYWSKTYFKKYVMTYYEKKKNANDWVERQAYKLLLNSLYGKFGQKEEHEIIKLKKEQLTRDDYKNNREISDIYFDRWHEYNISRFMNIHIASYITMKARQELYKYLKLFTINELAYCDTDSLIITREAFERKKEKLNIGKEIGQLKIVSYIKEFYPITNKIYAYKDENDKIYIKAKGFDYLIRSKDKDKYKIFELFKKINQKLIETGNYENLTLKQKSKKLLGFFEQFRRHQESIKTIPTVKVKKELKEIYNKRIILQGGLTKPISM